MRDVWGVLLSACPATILLSAHAPAACRAVFNTASRAVGPGRGPRPVRLQPSPASGARRGDLRPLACPRAAGLHEHAAGALRVHRVCELAAEPAAQAPRAGQPPEGRLLRVWRRRRPGQGRRAGLHRARPQGADGRGILGLGPGVTRGAARGLTQRGGRSPRLRGPLPPELHTLCTFLRGDWHGRVWGVAQPWPACMMRSSLRSPSIWDHGDCAGA
jgi:hypothetical protein